MNVGLFLIVFLFFLPLYAKEREKMKIFYKDIKIQQLKIKNLIQGELEKEYLYFINKDSFIKGKSFVEYPPKNVENYFTPPAMVLPRLSLKNNKETMVGVFYSYKLGTHLEDADTALWDILYIEIPLSLTKVSSKGVLKFPEFKVIMYKIGGEIGGEELYYIKDGVLKYQCHKGSCHGNLNFILEFLSFDPESEENYSIKFRGLFRFKVNPH